MVTARQDLQTFLGLVLDQADGAGGFLEAEIRLVDYRIDGLDQALRGGLGD